MHDEFLSQRISVNSQKRCSSALIAVRSLHRPFEQRTFSGLRNHFVKRQSAHSLKVAQIAFDAIHHELIERIIGSHPGLQNALKVLRLGVVSCVLHG